MTALDRPELEGLIAPDRQQLFALARDARRLPSWTRSVRAAEGGTYLSAMRGRGMEYDESRPYQAGDDVRHLDWRVMARRGEAHTKVFREERERPVMICVDDRAPMHFATRGRFKRVVAATAAAILAWRAFYAGDRIGAMVFSEDAHHELPPRRGKAAVSAVIARLCTPARRASVDEPTLEASLNASLDRMRRMLGPGTLVFLLSDFRGLNETAAGELVRLRRHCDLVLGDFYDPLERALPRSAARLEVANAAGKATLPTADAAARARYRARADRHAAAVRDLARRLGTPLMSFPTTAEPITEIRRLLAGRR